MKGRLISISILLSIGIMLCTCFFYLQSRWKNGAEIKAQQILAVNELEQLALNGDLDQVSEKSARLQEHLRSSGENTGGGENYLLLGAAFILCMMFVLIYVYFSILRPFENMKRFAGEIAKGNFDIPLEYQRSNYFGEFTWAFDSMRREITKSRSCEKEAIENNKTIIATLSHDIKTPIASIRAYAEGLEANMDSSAQKRQKYISVIMKKCDEVSGLTNDLFLHSVSDMEKLNISMEQFELGEFLKEAALEICTEQNAVRVRIPEKKIRITADRKRLMQVFENLINNARKYAKTSIDVSVIPGEHDVEILFQDYGTGILDEDMPFIYCKFYRGKNCGTEQGSGLGLYIVKYIIEKMQGEILICNKQEGLSVSVRLPAVME